MELYQVSVFFLFLATYVAFCAFLTNAVQKKIVSLTKQEIEKIVETYTNEREKSIKQYQEMLMNPVTYIDVGLDDQYSANDDLYTKADTKKKIFH